MMININDDIFHDKNADFQIKNWRINKLSSVTSHKRSSKKLTMLFLAMSFITFSQPVWSQRLTGDPANEDIKKLNPFLPKYIRPKRTSDARLRSVSDEDQEDPGLGQDQQAFTLFMLQGRNRCTAVLIHPNWLLSAHHCFVIAEGEKVPNAKGDQTVNDLYISISHNGGAKKKPEWTEPLKLNRSGSTSGSGWRKVKSIVLHRDYGTVETSYKGKDLVLVELEPTALNEDPDDGYIAPICLPGRNFSDLKGDLTDKLFYAGYGRRRVPHCITNMQGPDAFGICGRPQRCSKDHVTSKCGLEFRFQNKTHRKCLKQPTPSSHDPLCKKLSSSKFHGKMTKKMFIFDDQDKLLTTCYPFKVKRNQKGWCTTRPPTEDENKEPGYDHGWGFCSNLADQKMCNTVVNTQLVNTKLFPVRQLNLEYCVQQLKVNLDTEHIKADPNDYKDLNGLICIGRNYSNHLERVPTFRYDGKNFKRVKLNDKRKQALQVAKIPEFSIDGGACFGDSGGPLIKFVTENGVKKPMLVGIMSFLLWGTCRSQFDPSYYTRVKHYLDFIYRYVPEDEVCHVGEADDDITTKSAVANGESTTQAPEAVDYDVKNTTEPSVMIKSDRNQNGSHTSNEVNMNITNVVQGNGTSVEKKIIRVVKTVQSQASSTPANNSVATSSSFLPSALAERKLSNAGHIEDYSDEEMEAAYPEADAENQVSKGGEDEWLDAASAASGNDTYMSEAKALVLDAIRHNMSLALPMTGLNAETIEANVDAMSELVKANLLGSLAQNGSIGEEGQSAPAADTILLTTSVNNGTHFDAPQLPEQPPRGQPTVGAGREEETASCNTEENDQGPNVGAAVLYPMVIQPDGEPADFAGAEPFIPVVVMDLPKDQQGSPSLDFEMAAQAMPLDKAQVITRNKELMTSPTTPSWMSRLFKRD